ncbi:TetR/AcrR family transcriptional repressor of mexAB-oprM operon [Constrictibacter sp. MBR-5]|jgi:AcrR family transcriptional regulator|uniref:TetR family transcriptional regulator n=1 Tax=Constrictibacter sp. MBR-5 TaxID=3156467 RepID=UPI00339A444D
MRRTKEDAARTREQLLDAAESLFLEKGVSRTSLEEIARAAGMTRGAIYWHFRNKSDLFQAMHQRADLPLEEMMAQAGTEDRPLDALRDLCISAMRSVRDDERRRRVFVIISQKSEYVEELRSAAERQREQRRGFMAKSLEIMERAAALGHLAPEVSPVIAAKALHASMYGFCMDSLRDPEAYDLETDIVAMIDVFFRGLRHDPQSAANTA